MNKFISNVTERLMDKLGYVVVPKWRLESIFITAKIRKILKFYDIDCVIDVGANIGQYANFLRSEVGYNGLIISFEPDPNNINLLLKESRNDKNWIIKDCGLGSENTSLELNIMQHSVFNSFLKPDHSSTNRFSEENSITSTIQVPVKRLDSMLESLSEEHQFQRVYLKLDTQGFDLEVFKGALGCIPYFKAIQSEVSVLPIYKNMPSFNDSLDLFRTHGFEVGGLYPISESRFPHAIEFDCIYLPK